MSKTVFSLVRHAVQTSRALSAFGARNTLADSHYFITDGNNRIQNQIKGLKFRSGAWREDNGEKQWGLLWTMQDDFRQKCTLDVCFKQKMVKVTTKTGETVMAIQYDTSKCN